MDITSSTTLQLATALLVFLAGIPLSVAIGQAFYCSNRRSIAVYLWHTAICLAYFVYSFIRRGDSMYYYEQAIAGDIGLGVGTFAIIYVTAFLANVLGLSYAGTTLVFNIFGAIGLLAFDASLRATTHDKSPNMRRVANLFVFLPSASFWSASIGKDAISFMAAGIALWAAVDLNKRTGLMATAILIMISVRPHIAGIMVIAVTISVFMQRQASVFRKILLTAVAIAGAAALLPFALDYAGLGESTNAESVMNYVESRQASSEYGNSSVDMSSMSLPMQLFSYMFRPAITEATTGLSLAAGIENLFLLGLFGVGVARFFRRRGGSPPGNMVFLGSYSLMSWLVLTSCTSNLGIAIRQKWMFVPMLIFILVSFIGNRDDKAVYESNEEPDTNAEIQLNASASTCLKA